MSQTKQEIITILGSVQGVGFRPFVYRLAHHHRIVGSIRNTSRGVEIEAQGSVDALDTFKRDIAREKPERASISKMSASEVPLSPHTRFVIEESEEQGETTLALLPDTAMCSACLEELFDPTNRRYRYPFLHCMGCGPRFSLFCQMPFDRRHTTMTDFSMCPLCEEEYNDPTNRRFYSQTNCCPTCGPKLAFDGEENPLEAAIDALKQGKIVAMKNTGGYLLLVDATNEEAVKRLRVRKRRAKKPFAILMPTLSFAKELCHIDPIAEKVLTSPAAPIVLVPPKTSSHQMAPSVSCESPYCGIMLPHNPLQYLLLSALKRPLVATSGNLSGHPICIDETTAFKELSDVADAFLDHNRRIMHRLDDSIVQIIADQPVIMRRARGYIPYAIDFPTPSPLFASGGHLKNSFALAKDDRIYLSQYMGNLDTIASCKAYEKEVEAYKSLLHVEPSLGVGDKHPDYFTSHFLQKQEIPTLSVQHHKAHVFSGMLDNRLEPPFLSFSWDGTGLGDDNTIWGGEAFIVTDDRIERFASLLPFRLPGSEKAIKEPRRSTLGLLQALYGPQIPEPYQTWLAKAFTEQELQILSKGVNAPLCSSMGRLFDGISALLGCCLISDFEGESAIALEALARYADKGSPHEFLSLQKQENIWLIDWRDMVQKTLLEKREEVALGFHLALADVMVALTQKSGLKKVLLTGGVMQNKLLCEQAIHQLKEAGFEPYWHHQIPPNDSGLAPGQLLGALRQHVLSNTR